MLGHGREIGRPHETHRGLGTNCSTGYPRALLWGHRKAEGSTQPSRADVAPAPAMMNVTCPPGVQPGQTITITTSGGAPMTTVVRALYNPTRPHLSPHRSAHAAYATDASLILCSACSRAQVPPGVAPGAAFQVAVPSQ